MSKSKKAGFNLPGLPKSKRQDYPVIEAVVSKSKHTPGPWIVRESSNDLWIQSDVGEITSLYRATLNTKNGIKRDAANRANARLIAAAPEMLEALKNVLLFAAAGKDPIMAALVQGAIAKAEGRDK